MKILMFTLMFASFPLLAQDQEGNLQMPVTDVSEIQREEAQLPPTIDEVPMYEDKKGKQAQEEKPQPVLKAKHKKYQRK